MFWIIFGLVYFAVAMVWAYLLGLRVATSDTDHTLGEMVIGALLWPLSWVFLFSYNRHVGK